MNQEHKREKFRRINYFIRTPQVRVFQNNDALGVMTADAARKLAFDQGLDLVEISPEARPPVCHILDYGKFQYEEKIKAKQVAKKQREAMQSLKEVRLSPNIGDHDVQTKINHTKEFLDDNKKVQITMKFSRREMLHRDIGLTSLNSFLEKLVDNCTVEFGPTFDGNRLVCRIVPKSEKKSHV